MTDVSGSGTFKIGGDLEVHRLGYGAMRVTGDGVWGPPPDRERALAVLRRTRELGIDFIDTADSYGPHDSEELITEALHPFGGTVVATKGGFTRHGPSEWHIVGRPEYLRQCCLLSMRRMKVDVIDLWQLHRIDEKEPRAEQFGVMKDLQAEGKVRHLGLSEVTVDDIKEAQEVFEVTTVQNLYNVSNRQSEDVLEYCEKHGIGFIPWFPLGSGALLQPGGAVHQAAQRHGVQPSQVALAWLLARSPVMLPIPGTGSVEHLEENCAAADLRLGPDDLAAIDAAAVAT